MKRISFAGISAAFLLATIAGQADASTKNVSAKKLAIKDNAIASKRQVQVQSMDASVLYTDADDPGTKGASVAIYSATDDDCIRLPAGTQWTDNGKSWKYMDSVTMSQVSIANGKLQIKLKSGIDYSLADNHTQGTVNVIVQFGSGGTQFCMRCSAPTKDTDKQFSAKDCAATTCDSEAISCTPSPTTTMPTTTTTTTSTTLPPLPGTVLKAVLPKSSGLFTYAMTPGLPGADALCNSTFAGTHACTYTDLQAAEAAHDLDGIKDITNVAVTSFWAIDPAQPVDRQCMDAVSTRWHYATAHLATGGDSVTLNNATGALGALVPGGASNRNCSAAKWVGCCQ